MSTKTVQRKRTWLHNDKDAYASALIEEYDGYRDSAKYIDASLSVSDGHGNAAYLSFDHTRGDKASVRRARAAFDKLMGVLDVLDKHILDAEMSLEEDKAAQKPDTTKEYL